MTFKNSLKIVNFLVVKNLQLYGQVYQGTLYIRKKIYTKQQMKNS